MNALKDAIMSILETDAPLATIFSPTPVAVSDQVRDEDLLPTETPTYPHIVLSIQSQQNQYKHNRQHDGVASRVFEALIRIVDVGPTSKRAGDADERIEHLLAPTSPLVVDGHRTGFHGRVGRLEYPELSAGVLYRNILGIYTITLIPS